MVVGKPLKPSLNKLTERNDKMATTKFEKPVGSETFELQQQVSTMNTSLNALTTKVGDVGSTDLQTQVNTLNSNIGTWSVALTDATSISGMSVKVYKNTGLKLGMIRVNGSSTNTPGSRYSINYPSGITGIFDSLIAPIFITESGGVGYIDAKQSFFDVYMTKDTTWSAGSIIFPIA